MFDLREFAKEVHENAIKHGWWEKPRDDAEIIALIHSEWSEALEEYRAGRPMVYCVNPDCEILRGGNAGMKSCARECRFRNGNAKPEGIAVELLDGCIRILDYFAASGEPMEWLSDTSMNDFDIKHADVPMRMKLPELVVKLHGLTSRSMTNSFDRINYPFALYFCLWNSMSWIKQQGINPNELMLAKHEYNKTRSYKHGGKIC